MRIFSAAGPFAPLFFPPTRPKGVENFRQTNVYPHVFYHQSTGLSPV
jgi:hypothetical protein